MSMEQQQKHITALRNQIDIYERRNKRLIQDNESLTKWVKRLSWLLIIIIIIFGAIIEEQWVTNYNLKLDVENWKQSAITLAGKYNDAQDDLAIRF